MTEKSKKIDFRAEINLLICGGCFDYGDSMGSESFSEDESTIKNGWERRVAEHSERRDECEGTFGGSQMEKPVKV